MKIKFCYLITFVFLLITAGTGAAGTITVDNRGADYIFIQEAVDNTAAGDTILVYPGTYEENVNVNKGVTIRSYSGNPDDTIILAANSMNDVFYVTGNNVSISGFQISGADKSKYIAFLCKVFNNQRGVLNENKNKILNRHFFCDTCNRSGFLFNDLSAGGRHVCSCS